jgi:hypothetical protein
MNATGDSLFRATLSGATLSGTTVTIAAVDSARASKIADSAKTANFSAVLKNADSTSIRNYSNSLYLKNADSTTLKNSVLSQVLKNADSTSIRNYSTALYSGVSHNHTLDGLSNVLTTGKAPGNVLKWNGTNWADSSDDTGVGGTYLVPSDSTNFRGYSNSLYLKNADSTTLKNSILAGVEAGYLNNADSTTLKNSVLSQVLKNADSTTVKNSILSQVLKNADSTTVKNSILSQVLKNADSTTIKNGIAATYTTLVQRGTDTTRAIVRENTKISRGDTLALFVFGGGGGNATDTSAFTTSTYYGSFFNKGRDSIKVTSLKVVMSHGIGTDTLQVQVSWDDSLAGTGAVNLNTAALPVNSTGPGTEDTAFDNAVIPPNVWVWCKTPVVVAGRKPTYMSATLSGYRARP